MKLRGVAEFRQFGDTVVEQHQRYLLNTIATRWMHVEMDRAVLAAYGWSEVELDHEFRGEGERAAGRMDISSGAVVMLKQRGQRRKEIHEDATDDPDRSVDDCAVVR